MRALVHMLFNVLVVTPALPTNTPAPHAHTVGPVPGLR